MLGVTSGVSLPTIKLSLHLSTLTMTWSSTDNIMLHSSLTMNITFFTISEGVTHSAYVLDRVMLLCAFDCQDTGTPRTDNKKPTTLLLVTRSLTYSLLLKCAMSHHSYLLSFGSNFNPRLVGSSMYLVPQ